MLLPLLPFLILSPLALALPPQQPQPLSPSLIPNTHPLSLNTSDEPGIWQCTLKRDWLDLHRGAPRFQPRDCEGAVRQLMADATDYGLKKYEWSSWGTPFQRREGGPGEGRGTPMKWEHSKLAGIVEFCSPGIGAMCFAREVGSSRFNEKGNEYLGHANTTLPQKGTCTLSVVFLRDMPPWPSKPPAPHPTRLDTSYLWLYQGARGLYDECLIEQKKLGWFAPSESPLFFV